jgi:hypothetical protein
VKKEGEDQERITKGSTLGSTIYFHAPRVGVVVEEGRVND